MKALTVYSQVLTSKYHVHDRRLGLRRPLGMDHRRRRYWVRAAGLVADCRGFTRMRLVTSVAQCCGLTPVHLGPACCGPRLDGPLPPPAMGGLWVLGG